MDSRLFLHLFSSDSDSDSDISATDVEVGVGPDSPAFDKQETLSSGSSESSLLSDCIEEEEHPDDLRKCSNPYKPILVGQDKEPYTTSRRFIVLDDGSTLYFYEEHHFMPNSNDYFLPIKIGDIFTGGDKHRGYYVVVRKLGYGAFGTAWLSLWTSDCGKRQRYLVLKVLSKEASKRIELRESQEYEVFEQMTIATSPSQAHHPGYKHCMTLVDSTEEFCSKWDTYGSYRIFMMEPCGQNLNRLRLSQPEKVFTVSTTKRIVKQLLFALDYTHRERGLIHGDLKLDNLLVTLNAPRKAFDELLEKDQPTHYPPQSAPQFTKQHIITIKSQPLPNLGLNEDLGNIKIKLNDYSMAIPPEKVTPRTQLQIPFHMAPEVILHHKVDTAIDIWSLGCIIFECLTGEMLFDLYQTPTQTVMHTLLASIIEQIGLIPPEFLERCDSKRRETLFDDRGQLRQVNRYEPQTIEARMKILETMPFNEIEPAAGFICRCLTIDPMKRPTAQELLEDEWLRGVTI